MKKFILLGLLSIGLQASSQEKPIMVTGQISFQSKPIEAASVSLLKAADSSITKLAISDKSGSYLLENVKYGKYLLKVQAIGYQNAYSAAFEISDVLQQHQLNFELKVVDKTLEGVVVSTKKPLIEQKLDRTVLNVDASTTNAGLNALEVLEKSPGVTVDKDGNISLKGKQGVVVFIDGRPTYLSGADLANMLSNMTSAQLDQIEIMTNPPAKYDAAGNAGVINIKTKKTKQVGYSGSVSVGYNQGVYPKANESVNMNYRKNKVNLFSNFSHYYNRGFESLSIQRKFMEATTKEVLSHFSQVSSMNKENRGYNGKIGLDYTASKQTTLGLVVTGFTNPSDFWNNSDINIANRNNVLLGKTLAQVYSHESWKGYSTNANVRHKLDSTGKELTADIDYIVYDAMNSMDMINKYYDASGTPSFTPDTLLGSLPQNIKIWSFKTDYVHPLKNGAKFEAGLKSSIVTTDNNAIYNSLLQNRLVRDTRRSNHFIYEENINAAYINFSKQLNKKWSVQLGLRAENTIAKGKQLTTGIEFSRNYTQLFPTAYFQYAANEQNNFVFNYGRRIRRPDYESLNPFVIFLDRYTFEQGNPNLSPQFSHNIEVTHSFKGMINTTLNYTRTNNIIQAVIEQNELANETFVKQANIAKQQQYGIAVSGGTQIASWYSLNFFGNLFNNKFEGLINNEFVEIANTAYMLNLTNQFKVSKTMNVELSGFYSSRVLEGVFEIKPIGFVNMGLSKQVLKGKGTVKLNLRDIFWTQKAKGVIQYGTVDAQFQNYRDTRQIGINFTYRFSKGKVNNNQRRKSVEETERVRTGG